MGTQMGSSHWLDLARDVLAAGLQFARGLADWQGAAAALERAARDWRMAAGARAPGTRLRWSGPVPDGVERAAWDDALGRLSAAAREALAALDTVSEIAPDFVRLHERCVELMERLALFLDPAPPDAVRWVEAGQHQVRAHLVPLDIAQPLRRLWFPHEETAGPSTDADAGTGPGPAHDSPDDLPWSDEGGAPDPWTAPVPGSALPAPGAAALPGAGSGEGAGARVPGFSPRPRWATMPR